MQLASETIWEMFPVLHPTSGASVNADALPTVSVYKNGTVDATPTVTVTNVTTGLYKFTFTVPGGYAVGDRVDCVAVYAVGAVAQNLIVHSFYVGSIPTNNASGQVPVGSYASGQSPADLVLETPAQKIETNASGHVVAGSLGAGAIVAASFGTDAITADVIAASAVNEIADGYLDRSDGVETGITPRQFMRASLSVLAGRAVESSGTVVFKRQDGSTTAFSVTHDTGGNRTASTPGTLS